MNVKVFLRMGLMLLWLVLAAGCKGNAEHPELAIASFAATGSASQTSKTLEATDLVETGNTVHVCKSAGAKKYHYSATCRGLSNCKHEIVKMEKKAAENMGLGLCGWED